jgi:hypothetical protein
MLYGPQSGSCEKDSVVSMELWYSADVQNHAQDNLQALMRRLLVEKKSMAIETLNVFKCRLVHQRGRPRTTQ